MGLGPRAAVTGERNEEKAAAAQLDAPSRGHVAIQEAVERPLRILA